MDAITIILFIVVLLSFNIIISKKIFTYTNLFYFEWLIIMYFSSIRYDNYYIIEHKTYQVIALGMLFFLFGSLSYRMLKGKTKYSSSLAKQTMSDESVFFENNTDISDKMIMLVLIIHVLSSLLFSFKTYGLLKQGYSYSYIRNIYQGYDLNVSYINNPIEQSIRNWIALPLETIIPTIAICLLVNKKKIKCFFPLMFVDQFLYVFYSQNKGVLAYAVIYLFIVLVSYWKTINKRIKKIISRIIIGGSVAVIVLFAVRNTTSSNYTLNETLYKYVCGCVNMLDEKIKYADQNDINTYGMSMLYGFVTPIESILGFTPIGKSSFFDYVTSVQLDKDVFIRIGWTRWMNAYCTTFYDFYLDFRFWGIMLGSFILGNISEIGYNRLILSRKNHRIIDLAVSLNIAMGIIMSMIRWPFSSSNFAMAFIYYYFMLKFSPLVQSINVNSRRGKSS